jgi:hypothetical protein
MEEKRKRCTHQNYKEYQMNGTYSMHEIAQECNKTRNTDARKVYFKKTVCQGVNCDQKPKDRPVEDSHEHSKKPSSFIKSRKCFAQLSD